MEILIGKTSGFCYGVKRAVDAAIKLSKENVYCLGDIVNNKTVVDDLKSKGIKFIDDISLADSKTIIRAHGVSKEVYKIAHDKNIKLVDLTCPSVLKIHDIVDEYNKKKYYIVITGKKDHPEVIGIKSHADRYSVIYVLEDVELLLKNNPSLDKVLLISQTTYNASKFDEIEKLLRSKINNLEVKKTICPTTAARQKETMDIAKKVDLMIIVGDKNSSNTNKLYDVAALYCNNVIFVMNAKELDGNILKGINKVGIMAGASTPMESVKEIEEKIRKEENSGYRC